MLKVIIISTIVSIFNSMNPEEYLNKRIETIFPFYEKYKDDTYSNFDLKSTQYQITEEYIFYLKKANHYTICTNQNNIINNFSFFLNEQIDKEFFNNLKDHYGEPDYMFKIGKITETRETITEGGDKIGYGKTKSLPCTFEENPLFIGWNKEKFKITIRFNYAKNRTSISFTSKDEE